MPIRTAKATFLNSPHAKPAADLLTNKDFLAACDYSLLALGEELNNPMDAVANAQIVGARRVLSILQDIATPEQPLTQSKRGELNYST